MARIEQEGVFTSLVKNRIRTNYAGSSDCLWNVTAIAFNALVNPQLPLSGADVEKIAKDNNLGKPEFESVIEILGKKYGNDQLSTCMLNAEKLDDNQLYILYATIIDLGGLIFCGVDSKIWYKDLKSEEKYDYHALLIYGYETKCSKITKRETRKFLVRDPNISSGLVAKYEDIQTANSGPLTLRDVLVFFRDDGYFKKILEAIKPNSK